MDLNSMRRDENAGIVGESFLLFPHSAFNVLLIIW